MHNFTRDPNIDWHLLDFLVFSRYHGDINYPNGVCLYDDLTLGAMQQLIDHSFVNPDAPLHSDRKNITLKAVLQLIEPIPNARITFRGFIKQTQPEQPITINWIILKRKDPFTDEETAILRDAPLNIPRVYVDPTQRHIAALRLWS